MGVWDALYERADVARGAEIDYVWAGKGQVVEGTCTFHAGRGQAVFIYKVDLNIH